MCNIKWTIWIFGDEATHPNTQNAFESDYLSVPLLKTLKGEAEFDMKNLFKTRNEGGGAKITSRFKFPFIM